VHRSYSLAGDHIRVDIFDNRIEVESPGRFPGIASLGDPRDLPRFARNPRIARVAGDLGFGQELGEGIRRMFDEMRLAGYGEPVYHQTQASVRLTLAATLIAPDIADALPSRSREVMEYIRNAGGLSTGDVAERLGMSKPAASRRLRALRDAGYVEWVGKSPQDPRAFWRLASD
jgi:ATP-dependent DNA helicase RecG